MYTNSIVNKQFINIIIFGITKNNQFFDPEISCFLHEKEPSRARESNQ